MSSISNSQVENLDPQSNVVDLGKATGRVMGILFPKVESQPQNRLFETGAHRDSDKGKTRPDLLSPFASHRVAMVAKLGAEKYGVRNWEKGMPLGVFLASALRHMNQFVKGETDEDHLAHCVWNLEALMHGQEMIKLGNWPQHYDDLPHYCSSTSIQNNSITPIRDSKS